ncbi:hypothetical protein LCL86_10970 [Muricauda ruestringensis]|uniref:dual OB domain-containing protein n=1 Tax=Flagellimonas ruestringensis TaxID=111501 RepID=UPI001CD6EE17|nr:hypothetical protein [Allomuricauda ruestringensis]MCA0959567.1 hypothetical protein [Allomuricauda ruestringensis]
MIHAEVLITSKTKWGEQYCIGGIEIATGRFVRLMTPLGGYQPHNSPFEIGDIWKLKYTYNPDKPPHIEDIRVYGRSFVKKTSKLKAYVTANCKIWKGDYSTLFDGYLRWTINGSGYLGNPKKLPPNSVGFWISDTDLEWDGEKYYIYKKGVFIKKRIPYKGAAPPLNVIPKGTLVRMSSAKWLKSGYVGVEDRCYIQLSGWYL